MDRRRRTAALALVLALASLAASDAPPLAEMRWLAPGADVVQAVGHQPMECLRAPAVEGESWRVAVGRAAFRSPLVLGGQAARAGISCESCHRNGRTNPAFFFAGVSGAPGTADVTSSLFSSHRGNGVVDPVPIPDLGGPPSSLKISHDGSSRALETFIHGLITEEFDGPEPPAAVLDGLAAYVRALSWAACGPWPGALGAASYLRDATNAVEAAEEALDRKDEATAIVLLGAARTRLGRLDERYAGLPRSQAALRGASAGLAAIEARVRARDPALRGALTEWRLATPALWELLRREEPRSLFNHKRLAASARLLQGGR